jgi:predicted dehydrogenase
LKTGQKYARGDLGHFYTGVFPNMRAYFHAERPRWFLQPELSGGGMFMNVGMHRLATVRACLPGLKPERVSAGVVHSPDFPVEACTTALVHYSGGATMSYAEVGYFPPAEWMGLGNYFVFERGVVAWNSETWRLLDKSGQVTEEPLEPSRNYVPVYDNLMRALAGEPYGPTAAEIAEDVAIACAAYQSAEERREIDLTEEPWRIVIA